MKLELKAIKETIKSELSALTGIDSTKIEDHTNLFDLGLDSISAIQLVIKLEDKLGVTLDMADFFHAPNVEALAHLFFAKAGQTKAGQI